MCHKNNKKDGENKGTVQDSGKSIVFVKEGDLCPNCGFAKLIRVP